MSEGVFESESRSLCPDSQCAVLDACVEQSFGRLFGDGESFGLDEGTCILRDAVQLILKRDVESSGHNYIIAAVSTFLLVVRLSATLVLAWQEVVGWNCCATVLL